MCFSKFTKTQNNLKIWLITNNLYLALELIIIIINNSSSSNLELIVMLDLWPIFYFDYYFGSVRLK